MQTCAFTGHRPTNLPFRYNENHPLCKGLKVQLHNTIGALVEQGVTGFYTGMAQGTDIFCAEIVLYLKERFFPHITLEAVIPCRGQADKWPLEQQQRYGKILEKVDTKIFISVDYTYRCMLERNDYLVQQGDIILAVYDGKEGGGTAYTVNKAKEKGKKVMVIDPHQYTSKETF